MKKPFILLVLVFFVGHLLAQSPPTGPVGAASEQGLNQTLLDNAATSQKYLEQTSPHKGPTGNNIFGNKGNASSKTSSSNLTDQEKQLSENFIDQAGANRILKEKCIGEMLQGCVGNEVDHKVMGMDPALIKVIAQAYATFGAMSDSILPISAGSGSVLGTNNDKKDISSKNTNKKNADTGTDQTVQEKEKTVDYCKFIPTATETIAMFAQKNTVQSLSNGGESSQKEVLLKAAKSHEGRAEQAQIQAVGWYGGAACYAVNAGLGNYAIDKNLVIKMAAATFLGTVYQSEVANNKKYAEKTREIANSLPTKGACNPITENECYCATPEYENDPNFCKEQIAKKNAPSLFSKVACMDNTLKLDPSCSCEKSNSCFDKYLENQGAAELQLGLGYSNSPFKSLASLARGKLEAGTINSSAFSGTAAIAKKALNEFITKIPNEGLLNAQQKEMADAFSSQGLPANVSHLLAQNQPSQSAINSAMDKARGLSGGSYQLASIGKNNVLDFSGGAGLGIGGRKNEKKNSADDFLSKIAGKNGAVNNSRVLEFAEKAQTNVPQISNKSDRFLFDIISNRYQLSGRRLLQIDLP